MTCPNCGGTAREQIAPGWWRCVSGIMTSGPGPGAGAPPTGQFGPETVYGSVVCGTTYAEADENQPVSAICACGTFAVGVCTECGEPVCGSCSSMAEGRRVHRTFAGTLAAERAARGAKERQEFDKRIALEDREDEEALERTKRRIEAIGRALGERSAANSVRVRLRDKRGHSDKGPWRVWILMELTPPTPSSGTDHVYLGPTPKSRPIGVSDDGKLIQVYTRSTLAPGRGTGWPVDRPWMERQDFPWADLGEAAERLASSHRLPI